MGGSYRPDKPVRQAWYFAVPFSIPRILDGTNGWPPDGAPCASKGMIFLASMKDDIIRLKRERILEAARDLFSEQGYQGTTLDQVADRLEVTKPFIYSHFKSKAEILGELTQRGILAPLDAVRQAEEIGGDPKTRLTNLVHRFAEAVVEFQGEIAVSNREKNYVPMESRQRLKELQIEFDRGLAAILQDGADSGQFEIDDLSLTVLSIGGMMIWPYSWYQPGGRLSARELGNGLAKLVLRMVCVQDPAQA